MNLSEISAQLDETLTAINGKDVSEDKRIKLQLLSLDLRRQLRLGVFDILRDVDKISAVNTSQLATLTTQLKDVNNTTDKRNEILDTIIGVTKAGLRAAGLPIP